MLGLIGGMSLEEGRGVGRADHLMRLRVMGKKKRICIEPFCTWFDPNALSLVRPSFCDKLV